MKPITKKPSLPHHQYNESLFCFLTRQFAVFVSPVSRSSRGRCGILSEMRRHVTSLRIDEKCTTDTLMVTVTPTPST